MAFARRQLKSDCHILSGLSSRSARRNNWTSRHRSRLGQTRPALKHLVEGSGRRLIRTACDRGLERISEQLLVIVTEESEALRRPIEDSESRIAVMKQTIADAERSLRELGFYGRATTSLGHVCRPAQGVLLFLLPQADKEFEVVLRSIPGWLVSSYRRPPLPRGAQELARRQVLPWLKPEHEEGEKSIRRIALRFVEMAKWFLKKLANAGIPELQRTAHALDPGDKGFAFARSSIFWSSLTSRSPPDPVRWLADLILGLVGARWVIGQGRGLTIVSH